MTDPADYLVSAQSQDGGWGYKSGGMSYVEPTAAALLGLADYGSASAASSRGRNFLRSLQHRDGGWGIAEMDDESGWMTAWAVWALARDDRAAATTGSEWLLHTEGLRVSDPATVAQARLDFRMDARLTGWPWQVGDASWVFPTALALIALSSTAFSDHPRVEEGIRYLLDRALASGGWNIGNPFMLTGEPPATFANTSIALLSLGAFRISGEVVDRSYEWLGRQLVRALTPFELAWGAWTARCARLDAEAAVSRLRALELDDGSWEGNPFSTAIAMLALQQDLKWP